MNDAIEALAIGCTLTMIFAVPFAFFAFIRYLRYKETITLAERGLLRPTESKNGKGTLRWGVVLTFVGFALVLGLLPIGFLIDSGASMPLGPWLLLGCLPMFFGSVGETTSNDPVADPIPPHKQ
jgi:hypothetical protein